MKIILTLTQIAIVILFSLSAVAKNFLTNIALIWKPTTELTEMKQQMDLNFLNGVTFKVDALKDDRNIDPKKRIGENKEDPKETLPVETQADVAAFVTEHLSGVLKEMGAKVDDEGDYTITGELKDFFVTETNTYKGLAKIHFVLKKGGKTIWEHDINGKNSRFGRSYKYDNYMESLSDSLIDAVQRLLDNDEFKTAFQTKKGKS